MFIPVLESHGIYHPDLSYVEKVVGMMKERVNFIPELWDQSYYFFIAPTEYDEKTRKKRWKENSPAQLTELMKMLNERELFNAEGTEEYVKSWIEQKGYHLGEIMNAVRLALVGRGIGPHVFQITEAIGKEETVNRLRRAIEAMCN